MYAVVPGTKNLQCTTASSRLTTSSCLGSRLLISFVMSSVFMSMFVPFNVEDLEDGVQHVGAGTAPVVHSRIYSAYSTIPSGIARHSLFSNHSSVLPPLTTTSAEWKL